VPSLAQRTRAQGRGGKQHERGQTAREAANSPRTIIIVGARVGRRVGGGAAFKVIVLFVAIIVIHFCLRLHPVLDAGVVIIIIASTLVVVIVLLPAYTPITTCRQRVAEDGGGAEHQSTRAKTARGTQEHAGAHRDTQRQAQATL